MNAIQLIHDQLYSDGPVFRCQCCGVVAEHRVNTHGWVCCHNCMSHYYARTKIYLDLIKAISSSLFKEDCKNE